MKKANINMKKNMTGIILAGEKNSRMGTKKAFMTIDGVRLIDKILDVYQDIFAEIIIVANDPLAYTEFFATAVVTDIYKEKGLWAVFIQASFLPLTITLLLLPATRLS